MRKYIVLFCFFLALLFGPFVYAQTTTHPTVNSKTAPANGGTGATSLGINFSNSGNVFNLTNVLNPLGVTTTYTVLLTDIGKTLTNASSTAVAVTLPQAGTTGFEAGKSFGEINQGTGVVTITPTTSTINGNATTVLNQGQSGFFISDGSNYVAYYVAGSASGSVSSGTVNRLGVYSASTTISSASALTQSTTSGGLNLSASANGISFPDAGVDITGIAVAPGALAAQNANSLHNTAIGNNALNAVTSSPGNTAIGYLAGALLTSTTGFNTLVGALAGDNGAAGFTGSSNNVYGTSALAGIGAVTVSGSFNEVFGNAAMGAATSAANNIVMGDQGGRNLTTGSNNVLIQGGTGSNTNVTSLTTGSSNVIIGNLVASGSNLTTGSNNVLIGTGSNVGASGSSASNTICLGTTGGCSISMNGTGTVSSQNVIIGGLITLTNIASDATHTDAAICEDTTSHALYSGSGTLGVCLGTSSARYKTGIKPVGIAFDKIAALKPVTFRYIKGRGDNGVKQQFGFLAEDMVKPFPQLVGLDSDGKPNSVDIIGLIPWLVQALQEQQAEIEQFKKEYRK